MKNVLTSVAMVALLLVSESVFAGRDGSEIWARSEAHGGSATGGSATGGSAKGGSASQTQTASSYSGGQSVTVQGDATPNEITIRQAPDVYAPPAYATSPCRIAVSGGVSFLTGGVSLGGSTHDEECAEREWTRLLDAIGERQMALNVACNNARVKKANPGVCK